MGRGSMAVRKVWDKEKNAWVPVSTTSTTVIQNVTYVGAGRQVRQVRRCIYAVDIHTKIVTIVPV